MDHRVLIIGAAGAMGTAVRPAPREGLRELRQIDDEAAFDAVAGPNRHGSARRSRACTRAVARAR